MLFGKVCVIIGLQAQGGTEIGLLPNLGDLFLERKVDHIEEVS